MDHGVNVPFRMYATHFGNLLGDGETQLVTWYGCLVIYPDADLGSARPNSWWVRVSVSRSNFANCLLIRMLEFEFEFVRMSNFSIGSTSNFRSNSCTIFRSNFPSNSLVGVRVRAWQVVQRVLGLPGSSLDGRVRRRTRHWHIFNFSAPPLGAIVRVGRDWKLLVWLPINILWLPIRLHRISAGFSTFLLGSANLTSRKPWFALFPRPGETEFPMVGAWLRVEQRVEADTLDIHWSPKFGWSNLVRHSSHVEHFGSTSN